jgi:hypothetical protein
MDKMTEWQMPNFELEPITLSQMHQSQHAAIDHINQTIERLCERAKAKGPHVRLAVGSLEQNPRTLGWQVPYAFLEDPLEPTRPYWNVLGPWPDAADAKKGGEAEAPPPPLCGC